ncbi:MAG: hypothetical protein QM400_00175, partial [Spirochaetota bacterium]|nr:hypothetical protein [Spirochaetota bacterium]
MKKLIVLLLSIAMVGAVFAQDAPAPVLKWSGLLNTGFQYDTSTDSLYLYGQNAGKASRLRLNADYTNGDCFCYLPDLLRGNAKLLHQCRYGSRLLA